MIRAPLARMASSDFLRLGGGEPAAHQKEIARAACDEPFSNGEAKPGKSAGDHAGGVARQDQRRGRDVLRETGNARDKSLSRAISYERFDGRLSELG